MDKLHQDIFDNKKKCFILKGSIQDSMNRLKDESNKIIKEIVQDIYSIREVYMSDAKGYGGIMDEINRDLEKNKEETKKLKKDVHNCERRINHCENEIGYQALEMYNNSSPLINPKKTDKEGLNNKLELDKELNSRSGDENMIIEV